MCLNQQSGALAGVGGSDFMGQVRGVHRRGEEGAGGRGPQGDQGDPLVEHYFSNTCVLQKL